MLTTFQRDTYPFLIRCLFVCFSVIARFSSPKRPLLLHRHKPFVANRPAPVFRETGSLTLRAVPTATHHGDCRQQRSVGREIGKRHRRELLRRFAQALQNFLLRLRIHMAVCTLLCLVLKFCSPNLQSKSRI